jgi:hypothetical protein
VPFGPYQSEDVFMMTIYGNNGDPTALSFRYALYSDAATTLDLTVAGYDDDLSFEVN